MIIYLGKISVVLRRLDKQEYISDDEVLEFRQNEIAFYWKLKIIFHDGSVLFSKEYIAGNLRKYAFHGQSAEGDLNILWDNAPHYPHILTYPHHKHLKTEENVKESNDISLEEVLAYILGQIKVG